MQQGKRRGREGEEEVERRVRGGERRVRRGGEEVKWLPCSPHSFLMIQYHDGLRFAAHRLSRLTLKKNRIAVLLHISY